METKRSIGDPSNARSPTSTSRTGTLPGSYIRRLSPAEIVCERQSGYPCLLDVLAHAGVCACPKG